MRRLDHPWHHVTPGLRALSYRFAVRIDNEPLGRRVDELFAGLREPGPIEHWYSLTTSPCTPRADGEDTFDLRRDGVLVTRHQPAAAVIALLVWDVNRAAADSSREHLLLHAGAVQVGEAGVLLPAPSGSGKSTLSAALTASGLRYLSDELVALDLSTGELLPYPKPITVKPGLRLAALFDLDPEHSLDAPSDAGRGGERQLAVGDAASGRTGTPCVPRFVVVPRYVPGAATTLEPLTETQAFFELATNTVNFTEHGATATAALGTLVERSDCAVLTMSDLEEACRLVLDFTGVRVPTRAR